MGVNRYIAPLPEAGILQDKLTRVATDAFSIGREDFLHERILKWDMFMNDAEQHRYERGYNLERNDCEFVQPYYTKFGKQE